jgi:hypothetical protein
MNDLMDRINEEMAVYQMLERQSGGDWRSEAMLKAKRESIASLQLQLQRMLNKDRLAESRELRMRREGLDPESKARAAIGREKLRKYRTQQAAPADPADQPPMPYSERAGGEYSPAPQVAGPQMPPFMSTTPFGPMLGKTTQMTPELLALYNGEITPEEYQLLTNTP